MTKPTVKFFDAETNEEIVREMNDAEFAQHEIDAAANAAQEADRVAKIAAREAILEKLGLTADEAALLLG